MYFEMLHSRLVDYMNGRVRSGELTERGLARLAGISQPHLHNVLKGIRVLSAGMADHVILNLRLKESELGLGRNCAPPHWTEIPLLEAPLMPGCPFPDLQGASVRVPLPALELAAELRPAATQPVAVRLGPDPSGPALFQTHDVVLLEPLRSAGEPLDSESYYAIDAGGGGCLRRAELRGGILYLSGGAGPAGSACISLLDRNILEVVRARVIWLGRYLKRRTIAEGPVETAGEQDRRPGKKR